MSKSPRVNDNRLSDLLTASGFRSGTRWYGSYAWNRWNPLIGVSEWILVGFSGKEDEAISANVGVGVTRILAFGIKHELLLDVADVRNMVDEYGYWIPGRGRATIGSAEKAKAWERRLAQIAPATAEAYALQHGNDLLQRTAHARQRSFELLRQLDSMKSFYQQIQEFEARYGHTFRKEAERLLEWPGVMLLPEADELYLLACCAVLSGEQGVAFIGDDPLKNDELMWQIQLVVDGIMFCLREPEKTKEETGV